MNNDKYPDMSAMFSVQFEYENKLKDRIKELEDNLKIATDALKEISLRYQNEEDAIEKVWIIAATDMCDYADNALEKIIRKE